MTELLCPRLAAAGDKSRRKCEDSIAPRGFINPARREAEPGRMSQAQRLESKAEECLAHLLRLPPALCLLSWVLQQPLPVPPGPMEAMAGPGHRPAVGEAALGRMTCPTHSLMLQLGVPLSSCVLQPCGGQAGTPRRLTQGQCRHREQSPCWLWSRTALLGLHTLSEHTACARGAYSWTAGAAFISPVCSAEPLLPSPLRIESSEWQSCREFSWKCFLACLEPLILLQRKNGCRI